jgi:phosphoribosylaminoimidazolecarboxamide formyltransferase/IMP cyclohydrolase
MKKNLPKDEMQIKSVPGGLLVQEKDNSLVEKSTIKLVTSRACTEKEYEDLNFAWIICKHTKSNAIIYVKDKKTVGVGAGQMSRVDSAKIAALKQNNSVMN